MYYRDAPPGCRTTEGSGTEACFSPCNCFLFLVYYSPFSLQRAHSSTCTASRCSDRHRLSWYLELRLLTQGNAVTKLNMPSSISVTAACLSRSVARQAPLRISTQHSRLPRRCIQNRSSFLRPRVPPPTAPAQRRAFSASIPRQLADSSDSFDPKSVDREQDQVDVCIVGGGEFRSCSRQKDRIL
jgi:hypothetical protein